MSLLKKNIIYNYISQFYVTLIGIVLLPLYIKYMGAEAYGLVGFFAMLQAWFMVLDLGLTPTISRETARFKGGAVSALLFRRLFRALAMIFFAVAIIGGGVLFLSSEVIATKWLKFESLSSFDVIVALKIMGISVALRWMSGLYRGVVSGSEKLVWLSVFNSFIATLRFIGVFLSMYLFGFTSVVFFTHQLIVALIEFFALAIKTKQLLPKINSTINNIGWSFKPIKNVLSFSLTVAFTASVWVLVTQTDKLILSGILSLENYGYFTLAVLIANGVMLLSGPISTAVMPRMARLYAEQKHDEMIKVYRKSTQLAATIAGSVAITLIATAEPLLIVWTGDLDLAKQAAPILRLYAAGNLLLCVSAFSYYLQYAKGNLRYHLLGNIGLGIILTPSIIIAAIHMGGIGAGYVWLIMNILFLLFWVAYVHHKLEPGLHVKWLFGDVMKIVLPSSVVGFIAAGFISVFLEKRFLMVLIIIGVMSLLFIVSFLSSNLAVNAKVKFKKVFGYER